MHMFSKVMMVVLGLALSVSAANIVTFSDDFESYADGTVSPAPNWVGYNMSSSAQAYHEVDIDSLGVAHSGDQVYHSYRDATSLNAGGSCAITTDVDLRAGDAAGVYVMTSWAYLGSLNTSGSATQMSSIMRFWGRDAANNIGTDVGFKLDGHYNDPRSITYYDGGTYNVVGATIQLNTWMKVETVIDEVAGNWSFAITDQGGTEVMSRENLTFRATGFDGTFEKLSVYFQTNNKNDGWNNRIDDVSVEYVPEPATLSLIGLGGMVWLRRRNG